MRKLWNNHWINYFQFLILFLALSLNSCGGGGGGGNGGGTDTTPPSVPTGLKATPVSSYQIDLSWNQATDNIAVSGYNIFRQGSLIKSPASTSHSDTGLSPNTKYCYAISAFDAAGNDSGKSTEICATTLITNPFGAYLGEFNGVVVYSNDNYYCDPTKDPSCDNYIGNIYIGTKWQCVEYVRRYYFSWYGLDLASKYRGDANTWYTNTAKMGLESYLNGSDMAPRVGDILVSNGGGVGHLAIIRSVTANQVCTVQQNFSNDMNDVNRCLDLAVTNGNYTVGPFSPNSSNYPIYEWLRSAHIFASSGVGSWLPPSNLYNIGTTINGKDINIGRIKTVVGFEPVITDLALTPANILYGVSFDKLYQIDSKTGVATQRGNGLGIFNVNALASDKNGNLYGATESGDLVTIDANAGVATVIGPYGSGYLSWGDLAFSPSGILYASVRDSAGKGVLVTVDPNTGKASRINPNIEIGFMDVWGLSFVEDKLYGLGNTSTTGQAVLIELDKNTGAGQLVRPISFKAFGAMEILRIE